MFAVGVRPGPGARVLAQPLLAAHQHVVPRTRVHRRVPGRGACHKTRVLVLLDIIIDLEASILRN